MIRRKLGADGIVTGNGSYTFEIGKEVDPQTGHSEHASAFYMYATQAAEVAQRANVGLLVLTHLSNRYFGPEIAEEARAIFPETIVPRDFDVVEVPYAERGTPHLVKGGATRRREQEVVSSAPQ